MTMFVETLESRAVRSQEAHDRAAVEHYEAAAKRDKAIAKREKAIAKREKAIAKREKAQAALIVALTRRIEQGDLDKETLGALADALKGRR